MSLNRKTVGKKYAGTPPFDVSRQKIREFAAAIGDASPVYADVDLARSLGHRDLPAPPTFASVIALSMGRGPREDPEIGLDYSRVVHGEQRVLQHRPIYAGDALSGETSVADIRVGGRNELLTLTCDLATPDGEPVCQVTTVLVSLGTAPGEEG